MSLSIKVTASELDGLCTLTLCDVKLSDPFSVQNISMYVWACVSCVQKPWIVQQCSLVFVQFGRYGQAIHDS